MNFSRARFRLAMAALHSLLNQGFLGFNEGLEEVLGIVKFMILVISSANLVIGSGV